MNNSKQPNVYLIPEIGLINIDNVLCITKKSNPSNNRIHLSIQFNSNNKDDLIIGYFRTHAEADDLLRTIYDDLRLSDEKPQ